MKVNDGIELLDGVVFANPFAVHAVAAEGGTLFDEARGMFFEPLLLGEGQLGIVGLSPECRIVPLPTQIAFVRRLAQRFRVSSGKGSEDFGRGVANVTYEVHDFVVAKKNLNLAADLGRLGLETHHQIENGALFGTAIDQVSRLNEESVPAGPVARIVDQPEALENLAKAIEISVDIAKGNGSLFGLGGAKEWRGEKKRENQQGKKMEKSRT